MVSTLSIVCIVINMVLGIAVPVGLLVYFKKKYHVSVKSFLAGCAVMLLFALVLEQLVHAVVLGSPTGAVIQGNTWLYAVYGGLMAGLFEETGRFLAMRYVLKKQHKNAHNALMYGAGHGGFEMFVVLSIGMVNNLIYSIMINTGQTQVLLAPLDDTNRNILQTVFDTLIQTPSWQFVLSPVERFAAITAQIGLSVIVWFAAAGKKRHLSLLLLAIALHALLDAVAVLAAGTGISLIAVEAIIWIIAIIVAGIAFIIWKKEDPKICISEDDEDHMKMKNHIRKKIAPIVITVLLLLYFALYFGIIAAFIPGILKIVLGIIPMLTGIAVLYVCIQRIKEIDGGEEDDLSKY